MSVVRRVINFEALFNDYGMIGLTLAADSYKGSHKDQYRPDMIRMVSYIESRGYDETANIVSPEIRSALRRLGPVADSIIADALEMTPKWKHTVFFGLQFFIRRMLCQRITVKMVEESIALAAAHGIPFPGEEFMIIATELDGKVPLRIRALAEGSVVNLKNALVVVENTDDRFGWLVSYTETALLRAIWYPTSVATLSFQIKRDIWHYLMLTCDNPDQEIGYKLHDFGARGVSSQESAGIGGSAHIVNFMGTDTLEALVFTMKNYNLPYADLMPAHSIPSAEHSTITSWGGPAFEIKAFANMIKKFGS